MFSVPLRNATSQTIKIEIDGQRHKVAPGEIVAVPATYTLRRAALSGWGGDERGSICSVVEDLAGGPDRLVPVDAATAAWLSKRLAHQSPQAIAQRKRTLRAHAEQHYRSIDARRAFVADKLGSEFPGLIETADADEAD
jgi:hypothetical protein